jgi:hypothetical protein
MARLSGISRHIPHSANQTGKWEWVISEKRIGPVVFTRPGSVGCKKIEKKNGEAGSPPTAGAAKVE